MIAKYRLGNRSGNIPVSTVPDIVRAWEEYRGLLEAHPLEAHEYDGFFLSGSMVLPVKPLAEEQVQKLAYQMEQR